jgi:hypothetical protein
LLKGVGENEPPSEKVGRRPMWFNSFRSVRRGYLPRFELLEMPGLSGAHHRNQSAGAVPRLQHEMSFRGRYLLRTGMWRAREYRPSPDVDVKG